VLCGAMLCDVGVWYAPDEEVVRASDAALAAMSAAGAVIVDNVNIASALSAFLDQYNANTSACGASWNRYGITGEYKHSTNVLC
jgi:hypothetical protein